MATTSFMSCSLRKSHHPQPDLLDHGVSHGINRRFTGFLSNFVRRIAPRLSILSDPSVTTAAVQFFNYSTTVTAVPVWAGVCQVPSVVTMALVAASSSAVDELARSMSPSTIVCLISDGCG